MCARSYELMHDNTYICTRFWRKKIIIHTCTYICMHVQYHSICQLSYPLCTLLMHTVGFEVRMRLRKRMSITVHWMEKAILTGEWYFLLSTFLQSRSWLLGRKSTSTVWVKQWCQWSLVSPCSCGTTTNSHLTISLVSSEESNGDGQRKEASSAPPLPLLCHVFSPFTLFCHPLFFLPSHVLSYYHPLPMSSYIHPLLANPRSLFLLSFYDPFPYLLSPQVPLISTWTQCSHQTKMLTTGLMKTYLQKWHWTRMLKDLVGSQSGLISLTRSGWGAICLYVTLMMDKGLLQWVYQQYHILCCAVNN